MKLSEPSGNGKPTSSTTARDFLAILFRQRRLVILSFIGILTATVLFSLFLADRYEARMLVLVQQGEREDPVVTPANVANVQPFTNRNGVTQEEMNSGVELLRSEDVLEQVVVACGLDLKPGLFQKILGYRKLSKEERISKAVRVLADKLEIQVVKMSNLIAVSYRSSDPQLAAQVLRTLSDLYLQKHLAVHRPAGAFDFFEQETDRYRRRLSQTDAQLVQFTHDHGVVSAQLQTDATLQRLTDFQAMQEQTQASIAETEQRIRALETQQAALPSRLTTQVRTSDNAQLLQQLKSTLLTLELKRTELLEKFDPTYRPVQEVETQIAQTRAAIADAEKSQLQDVTTDRDPNLELVREELTKAQADLAGYQARSTAFGRAVRDYEAKAQRLQREGVTQQDLIRDAKAAEDNYLLYLRKQEEARISDALDSRRILNVNLAVAPTVPSLPVHSTLWYVVLGGLLACVSSVGLAFLFDNLDPTLRTADEVESVLNIPVLAALPKKANGEMRIHIS